MSVEAVGESVPVGGEGGAVLFDPRLAVAPAT